MNVKFKYGIRTYSGTIDEMVYGSYRKHRLCIGRQYVYPRLTTNNEKLGTIAGNLRLLWDEFSTGWKNDLATYALRNGSENVPKTRLIPSRYALYVKMMYAWAKDDPSHIDLTTLNAEDLASLGTPIATVKAAIESGYLPMVKSYGDLIQAM
jgi:hypothetical protein